MSARRSDEPGPRRVALAGPADFPGFREAARALLRAGVPPHAVLWGGDGAETDLFAGTAGPEDDGRAGAERRAPSVPRAFLDEAGAAARHRDPDRFALLYRILWRLRDEPGLLRVASDPDVARLGALAKAVRRDVHKMHAFVRFREVGPPGEEAFVAWYEPDHRIVEAAAPFFARRFAAMRWAILTPERCALWDGATLDFGPGAARGDAPAGDGLEALWRAYYAHVFNPARLNPEAMRAEMPKRFWKNLPEAALIPGLVAQAPRRAAGMIAAAPTAPVRRKGAQIAAEAPAPPEPADPAAAARACRACPLWEHATQAVTGEGPTTARLMIVGEQPGDEEDIAGRPFVGPAGRLLDRAMAAAGVDRGAVYLTNAVKHFKFQPRGKRRLHQRPSAGEIHACLPLLESELRTVDPAVALLLGASAAQAMLGRTVAVTRERGRPFRLPDGRWALIATHPAYILRLPGEAERAAAFARLTQDLRAAASLAA